jgi:hypothetical protein
MLINVIGCGKIVGTDDEEAVVSPLLSIKLEGVSPGKTATTLAKRAGFSTPLDILSKVKNPQIALVWSGLFSEQDTWESYDGSKTDIDWADITDHFQYAEIKNITWPFQVTFTLADIPDPRMLLRLSNAVNSKAGFATLVLFSDANNNGVLDQAVADAPIGPYAHGYSQLNELPSPSTQGDTVWGQPLTETLSDMGQDWIIGLVGDYAVLWVSDTIACNWLNKVYTDGYPAMLPFMIEPRYKSLEYLDGEDGQLVMHSTSNQFCWFKGLKPGYNLIKATGLQDNTETFDAPELKAFDPKTLRWFKYSDPNPQVVPFTWFETLERVNSTESEMVPIIVSDDIDEVLFQYLFDM